MSIWRSIPPLIRRRRLLPAWWRGFMGGLGKVAFFGTGLCSAVCLFYFLLAMRFNLDEVAGMPAGTAYFDRDGLPLAAPGASGRILLQRRDIPDFLVQALLAREDSRFYRHGGIDLRGLGRATVRNLRDMEFTQGASTLSMQLARNTYEIRTKSPHRKFLEMALTLRVEHRYGKEEILTHYLNRIYFGAGAHGLGQAAQTYFGKAVGQLDEGECAMLVGIIRGPSVFSPFRSLPAALAQRDQTLDRMVAEEMISQARCDEIKGCPIRLADPVAREVQASYAMRGVVRELNGILDSQDIRRSGLRVFTTLMASWQEKLERDLNQALRNIEKEKDWEHPTPETHRTGEDPAYLQCAAVTLDTRSGGVMALIGGRDYSHSGYDRSDARRDLGPAFEPLVAAAAAERGRLVLPGRPIQTGRQVGPAEVRRIAKRCGIKGLESPLPDSEDIFRGAVSATPAELAVSLATLGNKGLRPAPFFIIRVENAGGEVLFLREPDLSQAITGHAAAEASSVLARKGSMRCFTGATASGRDAWALRQGPAGSTAIWIGFDKPTAITGEQRLKALLEEFIARLAN